MIIYLQSIYIDNEGQLQVIDNGPESALDFSSSNTDIVKICGTTLEPAAFIEQCNLTFDPSKGYYYAIGIGEAEITVKYGNNYVSSFKIIVVPEPKELIKDAIDYLAGYSQAIYTGENDSLSEDRRIEAEKTLTIAEDAIFTIDTGVTLTVKGMLIVKGKIIVNGSLVKEGNGQVTTEEGGSIVDGEGVEYIPQNI